MTSSLAEKAKQEFRKLKSKIFLKNKAIMDVDKNHR